MTIFLSWSRVQSSNIFCFFSSFTRKIIMDLTHCLEIVLNYSLPKPRYPCITCSILGCLIYTPYILQSVNPARDYIDIKGQGYEAGVHSRARDKEPLGLGRPSSVPRQQVSNRFPSCFFILLGFPCRTCSWLHFLGSLSLFFSWDSCPCISSNCP